ncbi:hypothetical protein AUK40_00230 [Candidatus Wirthbacteria bacterium CG2_30_54_11]|uniref:AAA+ ATPase domain-containing protein n=1 Tax=Candidatus Wirthbacteria bacterium CG2_30_54_11 TaxID=1817892 RepID=A0A1J5J4S8_9BACT|nr:MAG: hypothetical protein AUK40_00230 [Candidatus Wirthbacteria bacterium CG2_30_54_11]
MARKKDEQLSLLDDIALENTITTYNPWWSDTAYSWNSQPFFRDDFARATRYLDEDHGLAILINGPRRIGKTTLMRQLMEYVRKNKQVPTRRIFFFSMDDPFVQLLPADQQGAAFERLLGRWEKELGEKISQVREPIYCFLDEVQRLPNWELYVKRYVDLRFPVRFVISGSASHTIFRKSLESLLGRLIEIAMSPFSFREWVRFHYPVYANALSRSTPVDIKERGSVISAVSRIVSGLGFDALEPFRSLANEYARAGGFPQLWNLDPIDRAQFVDLQFVQRVTLEDLRLIREIRRPEIFHQFLRYAFARTGEEYNLDELARTIKTTRITLSGALPLLLQTELIRKVERYSGKPVRLRSTHAKLYATDTMLFEAITKIPADLTGTDKGRIAETLAFNTLRRFAGITDITYLREAHGDAEIDFIIRVGRTLIPVEIKHRKRIAPVELGCVDAFIKGRPQESSFGIVVTEDEMNLDTSIIRIPLSVFLLLD